jgi:cell division protein FtsL
MADTLRKRYAEEESSKVSEARIVLDPGKVPLTKAEKFLIAAGTLIASCLMAMLIAASVSQTNAQRHLEGQQQAVVSEQNRNADLKQEIGELSSNTHLNQVAKKEGLSLIESNIRNIH